MPGTQMKLPLALACLVGLFAFAGCSAIDSARYGRNGGRNGDGTYSRGGYNYPSSARVGGSGSNARYRLCHQDRNSITVSARSVRAHLNHGDSFGNCRTLNDGRRQGNGRREDNGWNDGRRNDDDRGRGRRDNDRRRGNRDRDDDDRRGRHGGDD